jgi:hypothetical protein
MEYKLFNWLRNNNVKDINNYLKMLWEVRLKILSKYSAGSQSRVLLICWHIKLS